MTGIERIAAERQRQVDVEGWTVERDLEEWPFGELSGAGTAYADYACRQIATGYPEGHPQNSLWCFSSEWWKPVNDPIRNLEKAGALIAAEIDRLLALAGAGGGERRGN